MVTYFSIPTKGRPFIVFGCHLPAWCKSNFNPPENTWSINVYDAWKFRCIGQEKNPRLSSQITTSLFATGDVSRGGTSPPRKTFPAVRREETAVFASNDLHKQIFLANNEFYALACESSCEWCFQTSRENGRYPLLVHTFCLNFKQHESVVAKYHAESNLWDEVAPFPLGWRYGICIVAKDNFIYFLGGSSREDGNLLAKAGRYDLRTNKWVKIADLQRPRMFAYRAYAYGKVFIVGGDARVDAREVTSVNAYDELTNKWHLEASIGMWPCPCFPKVVCVDKRLFALHQQIREYFLYVRCYDWDNNSWKIVTKIPMEMLPEGSDTQIPSHTGCPTSVFSLGPFIRGKIRRVLHKTRTVPFIRECLI